MTTRRAGRKESGSNDEVRAYLKSRGVSDDIVAAGLPGIVARWESIARAVDGYRFSLDDWLNDVDLRDVIAGALEVGGDHTLQSVSARLAKADDQFREATVASGPVWGARVAASHRHDSTRTWWYFRIPRRCGETLASDLKGAGLS